MYNRKPLNWLAGTCLLALLVSCAGTDSRNAGSPILPPEPMAEVSLERSKIAPKIPLEVAISLFEPGIPEDAASHRELGIYPQIRQAEARYIPYILRRVLVESNHWGPVRVVPGREEGPGLHVEGRILTADGLKLALRIEARDASGALWLDKTYRDQATESDYQRSGVTGDDPFQDLYHQIANDLNRKRLQLGEAEQRRLNSIAELRYAAELAPDSFDGFLARDGQGNFTIQRLPAEKDPMLSRVRKLRQKQYLFTDTVDEQYQALYEEMGQAYLLWRQYGREIAIYRRDRERRLQNQSRAGRKGSFAAMEQAYSAYRWTRLQDEDMEELARGFNNEVAPTVIDIDGRIFRLSGSLEKQYHRWRDILRQLFALETGL